MKLQRDYLDDKAMQMAGVIEKTVNVTYDGKQCAIKVPSKLARILRIKKGDKVKFTLLMPEGKVLPKKNELKIEMI
ncbi:MAG TPA: hypothetical protein VJH23_03240 [archaeon]|nr:hypothetical protein [archaeon]